MDRSDFGEEVPVHAAHPGPANNDLQKVVCVSIQLLNRGLLDISSIRMFSWLQDLIIPYFSLIFLLV